MQTTIPLLTASERARGRVMGLVMTCVGTGPLGALWIGFAAAEVGAPLAIAAGGLFGLLLMWPVMLRLFLLPGPVLGEAAARPAPRS
jgi:hypothetical protein